MKNNDRKFHQILIQPQKTEKLFYNKSLKSNYLYNCLNKYFDVDIEIEFPSASFKQIFDLVTKIKNKKVKFANVGIIFKSLQEEIPKECFSDHISYTTIAISEHTIPTEVFKDNKSLRCLFILPPVVEIQEFAFSYCSSLVSITIPSSVKEIGSSAFKQCYSLFEINLPPFLTSIEESTFQGCESLTSIEIPSSVTYIGYSSFYGCSLLANISIPTSVNSIGPKAFYNCSNLTAFIIPPSVTSIGKDAFQNCGKLEQISVPSSIDTQKLGLYPCVKINQY